MTNNEKKKINDKKYKRKNTIIAIVGVILIAILFITCIDVNAFDDLQGTFIPFSEFELNGTNTNDNIYRVTVDDGISVGATVNISYIIKMDVIKDLYCTIYRRGSYSGSPMISSTSNYAGGYYNTYSTHYHIETDDVLQITVPKNAEIYGLYLYYVDTDGTPNMNNYNEIISQKLVELNTSKYINHMLTIDAYEDDLVNLYSINEGYLATKEYYANSNNTIIVNGQIAITNGVSYYKLTIDNISKGIIDNPTNSYSLTDDFVSFVNSENLNITNFDSNGYYELYINLYEYVGQMVSISVSAVDVNGIVYNCFVLPIVYVYRPEIDTETETETETDTPISPGDGSYKDGYDKGYQSAFRDMLNGNLVGGKLEYIIRNVDNDTIVKKSHDIVTAPYAQINWDSTNGLSFNQVYETWYNLGGTFNNILTQTQVHFTNPVFMPFNVLTIKLPDSVINEGVPKINVYGIIKDSNSESGYRLVATTLVSIEEENKFQIKFSGINELVYGIEITGIMPFALRYTYLDFDNSVYALNEYSYNEGYNYGLKLGKISGKDIGYKEGYEEGKKIGYDEGVESTNMFYKLFTALFDSFIYLLTSLLSFEVFGVNVLGFLSGIITLIGVLWVIKRLFG